MERRTEFCPLLKKDCIALQCAWFTQVRGTNTNTGKEVDEWGCAMAWLPILTIENSNQQRQTGSAVESFRNEMINSQNEFLALTQNKTLKQITK